jgi:hypothetical protein
MSPLKGIFNLQVEYGFSYNALDRRMGIKDFPVGMEGK